jgi:hypothetical protein
LYLLNSPFDPAARQLPRIYFSGDWYWQPDNDRLEPRAECWGGLLLALTSLWIYVAFCKRDVVARNIGLVAVLAGAIGFPTGQSLQAYHAWNVADFRAEWLASIDPYMNWWNLMETTFGAILGAGLGLGAWLHRRRIAAPHVDEVEIPLAAEAPLLLVYAAGIAAWNFMAFKPLDAVADNSLTTGLLPLVLIVGGRYSPYFISLPIVALPICGKTLRELSYYTQEVTPVAGWALVFILPMAIMTVAAAILARHGLRGGEGQSLARWALFLASWLYFGLNLVFFRAPAWPFGDATSRTPSTLVFSACVLALTLACFSTPQRTRAVA